MDYMSVLVLLGLKMCLDTHMADVKNATLFLQHFRFLFLFEKNSVPDSVVASATAVLVNDPELLLIVTVPVSPLTSFAEIVVGEIARFVVPV